MRFYFQNKIQNKISKASTVAFLLLLIFLGAQLASLGHSHELSNSSMEHSDCSFCIQADSAKHPHSPQLDSMISPLISSSFPQLSPWTFNKQKLITPLFSRPPPASTLA